MVAGLLEVEVVVSFCVAQEEVLVLCMAVAPYDAAIPPGGM